MLESGSRHQQWRWLSWIGSGAPKHQVCYKVQSVQVPRNTDPALRAQNVSSDCRYEGGTSRYLGIIAWGCYGSGTGNKTNDFVQNMVVTLVWHQESLLAMVKQYIVVWFGIVTQRDTLSKNVHQGVLEDGRPAVARGSGSRRSGRTEWEALSLFRTVCSPQRPMTVKGQMTLNTLVMYLRFCGVFKIL